MKTINLKKYYYPICKKDTFVEVPDEVADAIVEESRAENANDAKQHYHCYSLDASPGIEHHFPEQVISPEDILMEKETEREQEAAHALMMQRLREALATLTPTAGPPPARPLCGRASSTGRSPRPRGFTPVSEPLLPIPSATPLSSCGNIISSAAG